MKSLSELVLKYPLTDKGPLKSDGTKGHNYTEVYEKSFRDINMNELNILEIGFGGGDSLKLWLDYFPNAKIYCVDNNLSRIEEYGYTHHERIKILYADQSKSDSLESALSKMNVDKFDIIIDDGSHIESHIRVSFNTLFDKYLNDDGIYFVEDAPSKMTFNGDSIENIEYSNSGYSPAYLITIKKNK